MSGDFVAEWLKFADDDLEFAEHGLSMYPKRLEIICYHCQQAAEKYLKGYLIAKGTAEPPRTHDLELLYEMCTSISEQFNVVEDACANLTRYGSQPRYPREIEITENDMQRALEYARQVKNCPPLEELRTQLQ